MHLVVMLRLHGRQSVLAEADRYVMLPTEAHPESEPTEPSCSLEASATIFNRLSRDQLFRIGLGG